MKINSLNDSLKEIKNRISNKKISFEDINIVLENQKGKYEPKSMTYYLSVSKNELLQKMSQ